MSLKTDVQEILDEVFADVILGEEIGETMVYHSARLPSAQIYDPESGRYVDKVSEGDGAFWFDDEDNSHWLAVF